MRLPSLTLCLLCSASLHADTLNADDALDLVEQGKVMSLEKIISMHPEISQSTLLDLQLELEEDGQLIYQFEILNTRQMVVEYEIDAASGRFLLEEFEE